MESSTDYMSGDLTPVASGTYLFDGLDAEAVVRIRGNSKKITARWKGMEVYVNVPPGLPVRMLREFMADHKEQLKAKRPALIYHELAHLSEMNHGEAFHRLCDRYLEGKEHELRARLAEFRFPVF